MKTPSFRSWRASLRAINPIQVNRTTEACDWIDSKGIEVFHERTNFPWNIFVPATSEYWPERVYTDKTLADSHARQYNGLTTECFYSEPQTLWFVRFSNFEDVAKYVFDTNQP